MKTKSKSLLILVSILLLSFLLGFMTKSLLIETEEKNEMVKETRDLIDEYNNIKTSIDSISNLSTACYDSANLEMMHYALNYNKKDVNKYPNYYISNFNDTIYYNKENFYYYTALYLIGEHLLNTRKYIISGLILDNKKNQIEIK